MNKTAMVVLGWESLYKALAFSVGLTFAACGVPVSEAIASEKEQGPVVSEVLVGPEDSGKRIAVGQGRRVILRLPENPSTGYRWELQSFAGDTLELQADRYQPPAVLSPGAGGFHLFELIARAPGQAFLRLRLTRPWEAETVDAEMFDVAVTVSAQGQLD
jgi:inhibitor of cysteine peptidase